MSTSNVTGVQPGVQATQAAAAGRPSALGVGLQLSSLVALQIGVNVAIQWYVVSRLGAAGHTDALYAGSTLPQILISVGVDNLTYVLVPLLAALTMEQLAQSGWALLFGAAAVFSCVAAILHFVAPFTLPLIVPGYSDEAKEMTVSLATIQVLTVPGAGCYAVLSAISQVKSRFVWPLSATVLCSIGGLALLKWKLPVYGVHLAAWVQVLIALGPVFVLLPILGPFQVSRFNRSLLREIWKRMRPLVLGTAYFRSTMVVDRFLTSFLAPGSLVILSLAEQVHSAIARMVNQGIVTPVVPTLSKLAHRRDWPQFRELLRRKSLEVGIINGSMLVGLVVFWVSMPVITKTFPMGALVGKLTPHALGQLLTVFVLSSGFLLCSGLKHTMTTAFYSSGNTRTPTTVGVASFTLGLGMKVAGFFLGGLAGIALSISIHNLVHVLLLFYFLRREYSRQNALPVIDFLQA